MRPPALSRPFDLSYRSNVFVLAATPAIGVVVGVGALILGEPLGDAARWGFYAGGAAFLAWAATVELHPDRASPAALAALLGPVGLVWGTADLLANAVVLLVARAVAGTTGRSMRTADIVLLGVVGAPVVVRQSGPAVLTVATLGLAATVVWHRRGRAFHATTAAMYAGGAAAAWIVVNDLGWLAGDGLAVLWVGLVAGAISLAGPRRVATPTDRTGGTISPGRVRTARLVALVAAGLVSATHEPAAMAPTWAALLAVALDGRGERKKEGGGRR